MTYSMNRNERIVCTSPQNVITNPFDKRGHFTSLITKLSYIKI